jgi:hypothetical protein
MAEHLRRSLVARAALLLATALPACSQHLTNNVYRHEQAAYVYDQHGDYDAAAAERRAADRDRRKLGRIETGAVHGTDYW